MRWCANSLHEVELRPQDLRKTGWREGAELYQRERDVGLTCLQWEGRAPYVFCTCFVLCGMVASTALKP